MKKEHIFNYDWRLADGFPAAGMEHHGCKAFGTFVCGGGSSMGYKLAGYDHLGGVELDPKVAEIYRRNLSPKYLFNEDIRAFNARTDIPDELYQLDLLDGSPPCSTFSMAGSREKAWGVEKRFAEGQKLQRLDDLVFVYCETIAKLRPKVFILENVAGLVQGKAREYARGIFSRTTSAGYRVQIFILNAATMGVPQARKRCFFIGLRDDYATLAPLALDFNEPPIPFGEIKDGLGRALTPNTLRLWEARKPHERNLADVKVRIGEKYGRFCEVFVKDEKVAPTVTAPPRNILYSLPAMMSDGEVVRCSSFPTDYDFTGRAPVWLCGMSVPPVMTAQIARQIWLQWLRYCN